MGFNERKLKLLHFLSETGPLDSNSLARAIVSSKEFRLDIHALRMALMRYYKQGLLRREKVEGVFRYDLSERGIQRLHWLEEQTKQ